MNNQFPHITFQDEISGLLNRRAFKVRWEDYYRTYTGNSNLAILVIDIDRFKKYNESLGKKSADLLLKMVSRRLMKLRNEFCEIYRYNGDEFVFIMRFLSREEIESLATGNQESMRNIGQDRIKQIRIPVCSLREQQAIVQEIETRLSVCDKIEQDIKENLEKAEALRQSILKKAFEGKLLNERELAEVRGAEDWEPAEVLLERIRKERAKK